MQMMIVIDMDNAAFEDGEGTQEAERLLASIASRLPDPLRPTDGDLNLHDANGNHVGFARITAT